MVDVDRAAMNVDALIVTAQELRKDREQLLQDRGMLRAQLRAAKEAHSKAAKELSSVSDELETVQERLRAQVCVCVCMHGVCCGVFCRCVLCVLVS